MMNGTELRSYSHFLLLTKIAYKDHNRNLEDWLIFEVCLHSLQNCESQSK